MCHLHPALCKISFFFNPLVVSNMFQMLSTWMLIKLTKSYQVLERFSFFLKVDQPSTWGQWSQYHLQPFEGATCSADEGTTAASTCPLKIGCHGALHIMWGMSHPSRMAQWLPPKGLNWSQWWIMFEEHTKTCRNWQDLALQLWKIDENCRKDTSHT